MQTTNRGRLLTAVAALLFVACVPGYAQVDEPGLELFGGYSHQSSDVGQNGWEVEAGYRPQIIPPLSFITEISRTTGAESIFGLSAGSNTVAVQFGPRVFIDIDHDKLTPFANFLFGFAHNSTRLADRTDSDTGWTWSLGGGLDYALSDNWAARGKLEILRTHFFGTAENNPRISLGLRYRFGTGY